MDGENLFARDHERIVARGRRAGSVLRVHAGFQRRPVTTLQELTDRTGLSFPTVSSAMEVLVDLGIGRELTGRRRDRVFSYREYLGILAEGTEPP